MASQATTVAAELSERRKMFRHPAVIRVAHWLNVVCLTVLLASGLQIFNAHPALYWGEVSTFDTPLMSMTATEEAQPRGVTTVLGRAFDTTGVLGLSNDASGEPAARGFPSWTTLPGGQNLAGGRSWHFFFAWVFVLNGFAYLAYGIATGRLKKRLVPTRDQFRDFGATLREHLSLRFPKGEEATRYNALQKLTYLVVVLVLLPAQLLTGLAMSPAVVSAAPVLLDMFGGRQSARTLHFVIANLLVLFVIVHVLMVLASGLWNNLRGMVTGWFVIETRSSSAARLSNGDAK